MRSLLPILSIVFLVAACGANRPAVERQSFLIQPERPGHPVAGKMGDALGVGKIEVAPPFDSRALVYRRDDVRYEMDPYNEFAADPADMLAEAAAAWLRKSGFFLQVSSRAGNPGAYRLGASVGAMYVDFRSPAPAVVLNLRWRLGREGEAASLLDLECDQRVELAERSPSGAARAYRDALQQALVRLERELAAIPR